MLTNSQKATYEEWLRLVNMTDDELQEYYDSPLGQKSGLSRLAAKSLNIKSGRESARNIVKMKQTPPEQWTEDEWEWANRQIRFIKRMRGVQGPFMDGEGGLTRKAMCLYIWGDVPLK